MDVRVACAAVRSVEWSDRSRSQMHADNARLAEILSDVPVLDLQANTNVHFQYAFCERAHEVPTCSAIMASACASSVQHTAFGPMPCGLSLRATTSASDSPLPSPMWSVNAPQPDRAIVGVGLAAAGAMAYGVATVIGRALAGTGVDCATALGIRFAVAAAILATLLRLRGAPMRLGVGESLPTVLLGAVGYTLESTLFYLSLGNGSAAACI